MNPIKKLLSKTKPPAAEIRDALEELARRETEIDARLADLYSGSVLQAIGAARKRCQLEGTPAELVAMDAEERELQAEKAALPTKRAALNERLSSAQADEAVATLPGQLKALPSLLSRWQAAQAAASEARAEMKDALTAIGLARRAIEDQGGKAPGVAYEVAAQVADALGFEQPAAPTHYSRARADLFQRLGSRQVEMEAAEKEAQRLSKQDGFASSKADDTDLARHPEQSIWAKKAL